MADKPIRLESGKKFKRIEDPILARNLMVEAVDCLASVTCMGLPGQEVSLKGKFRPMADGKTSFWIAFSIESYTANGQALEGLQSPFMMKFTIFIPEQPVICFEAEVIEVRNEVIHFKNPEKMFFIQRRTSRRHRVPAAYELWVEYFDPHYDRRMIKHRLFDISSGGISFLVGTGESRFYSTGLRLNPVYLTLQGEKLTFTVEIRMTGRELTRLGKETGILVGCQFVALDKKTQSTVDQYIYEGMARGRSGKHTLE